MTMGKIVRLKPCYLEKRKAEKVSELLGRFHHHGLTGGSSYSSSPEINPSSQYAIQAKAITELLERTIIL
jgi:hypothetical protein